MITFICVSKSLNDEERGGNCLLVPERNYGPRDLIPTTKSGRNLAMS